MFDDRSCPPGPETGPRSALPSDDVVRTPVGVLLGGCPAGSDTDAGRDVAGPGTGHAVDDDVTADAAARMEALPDGTQLGGWISGPGSGALAALLDDLLAPAERWDPTATAGPGDGGVPDDHVIRAVGDGAGTDQGAARPLSDLCDEEPRLGDLSDADLVEFVAAFGRVAAWAQGRQARLAAELSARRTAESAPLVVGGTRNEGGVVAAAELSLRMGTSPYVATGLIRAGRAMATVLTATGAALGRGELDWAKARVLTDGLAKVPVPVAWAVEDRVLPTAPTRSAAQLRRDVAAALIEVDPIDAAERHRRAVEDRRVERPRVLPDGMALMKAYLPAESAMRLDAVLHGAAVAARVTGDPRTVDQLRADGLDLLARDAWNRGRIGPDPAAAGAGMRIGRGRSTRTQVHVTVGLTTLMGLDEHAGHLRGYGPVDADTARRLAADGTWRRLLVDEPTGTITDVGRTRYAPPADLAELITARYPECVVPTCSVPALASQLDHTTPFPRRNGVPDVRHAQGAAPPAEDPHGSPPDGPRGVGAEHFGARHPGVGLPGVGLPGVERRDIGHPAAEDPGVEPPEGARGGAAGATAGLGAAAPDDGRTSAGNLAPLCAGHHQAKTAGRLRLRRLAGGGLEVTTPTGHRYRAGPVRPAGVPGPASTTLPRGPDWLDRFALPAPSTPPLVPPDATDGGSPAEPPGLPDPGEAPF